MESIPIAAPTISGLFRISQNGAFDAPVIRPVPIKAALTVKPGIPSDFSLPKSLLMEKIGYSFAGERECPQETLP